MGGSLSKAPSKHDGLYAEIRTGKEQEANIRPIKVLMNAKITSTAVDSLKDSEQMIHLLAEELVVDALTDKNTPKKFGEFLGYIFSYESTRSTTRDLVYWSLKTPESYQNIYYLSKWHTNDYLNTYGPGQLSAGLQAWVLTPEARKTVIRPLLTWTLRQQDIVVDPLADILKTTLPWARPAAKEGIKYAITENLKSEGVKTAVKDAIVGHLSKIGKVAVPVPAAPAGGNDGMDGPEHAGRAPTVPASVGKTS